MEKKPAFYYRQSGVIPFIQENNTLKIMLVTSRRKKRWVIPKGIIERELSPAQSAVKEAFEEAGICGTVSEESLGTYSYSKWGGTCFVEVFSLAVTEVLSKWPEKEMRKRQFFTLDEVLSLLEEPELKKIVSKFKAQHK